MSSMMYSQCNEFLSDRQFSLITEWRIVKRVQEQFQALMTGFYEVVPPELINVFDEKELELLIGGIAEFDMEDWKKNTEYKNYTVDDQVIKWFWKVGIALIW